MRNTLFLIPCLMLSLAGPRLQAQGTFQDLDFESATIVPVSGSTVQFSAAFPGWTGSEGGVQLSTALYNSSYLDSSGISMIDRGWSGGLPSSGGVIAGNYTALLEAGLGGHDLTPADTTLSQTGVVPATAQSLQFAAYLVGNPPLVVLNVTLGGQELSLTPLASGANYTLYGADIHAFAGQTAELDFTLRAEQPHTDNRYAFLDSIQFSDQPVPEPGVSGLLALGAVLLGWRTLIGRRR